MTINYLAVLIAAIAQFIIGFIWYGPIFGNLWGRIHGFDKLPKEVQMQMMKGMTPFYVLQFFVTLVTTVVLAIFIANQPEWNAYAMAGFFWVGFVVPTQVGAVIFGGTEGKWVVKKLAVMAGASLLCLEAAAAILAALA